MNKYRTHTCGELSIKDVGKMVTMSGWVQRISDKGKLLWIDLRDRYGITQLLFEKEKIEQNKLDIVKSIGREFVISISGKVIERFSKNLNIKTGEIEIEVENIEIINSSKTPPFTIEDNSDGGDELRMKWRYLDLRRNVLKNNLLLRHEVSKESRRYLDSLSFMEIETPYLIKSTPEGARDFVVPSRINTGQFYALPQSPQTFKQILMVAGYDKYYQIVRCFRDEDLRSDRQPEFTQIDCEMSFVEQKDILNIFEGLVKHLFKSIKNIEIDNVPIITYNDAISRYGSDKPDIRFDMKLKNITNIVKGKGFSIFDNSEAIIGMVVKGCSNYTRKQIDEIIDFSKRPQIGSNGLIYCMHNIDGSFKSSVDKFYSQEDWVEISNSLESKEGDLILIMNGNLQKTLKQMGEVRLFIGGKLGLRDNNVFKPLWVIDFPLFELDESNKKWSSMHHPFTAPKNADIEMLDKNPGDIIANAYDFVINGTEVGGGSIRIHNKNIQSKIFNILGFTDEDTKKQFGFLLDAFEYGAPPHGGIAFGFDRMVSILGGSDSIRDFIAFPKNNSGRDVMINAPSNIDEKQLNELGINLKQTT